MAQVVPSGATATHASTASNGQINVNIAAPNTSGISANRYSTFSAPPPGVNLINLGVNASTIVNQVTSNNASYLRGPLAVVGPTANVILANPNGIVVNGGSFINVGGVALSTGPVSYANSTTVPGYQNVVLGTGGGNILVTGAGLVGSMSSLQLIAGSIEIDGPIANTSSNANINVAAGNAQVTLDSSVVPGSTLTPWATTTALGGSSSSGILVDVTPNGSLSAGRISMEVSGNGAGVSFQGHGMASIGEFSITADGKVSVLGGQIQAEKDVKVVASAIDVLNQGAQTATLA
jgi:filamentous hemagglutinin family protein